MSLTIVLILFAQVILTWLVSPLLAGIASAICLGDTKKILQPYRDLLVSLRGSDQIAQIAWAILMMLVLLMPVISLRAPFDWMGDSIFMWFSLLIAQLLLATQAQRITVLLGNISFLFLLLGAAFAGQSFHSTVILSNGIHLGILALIVVIVLLAFILILWSRVIGSVAGQFRLKDWSLWTSLWIVVLWVGAILFPASLAISLNGSDLLLSAAFLVVKFIVSALVFSLAVLLYQKIPNRLAIILQVLLVVLSAGFFSYFVLA